MPTGGRESAGPDPEPPLTASLAAVCLARVFCLPPLVASTGAPDAEEAIDWEGIDDDDDDAADADDPAPLRLRPSFCVGAAGGATGAVGGAVLDFFSRSLLPWIEVDVAVAASTGFTLDSTLSERPPRPSPF